MRSYGQFYINGEWVKPARSEARTLVNPTTEEPFAEVVVGSEEDVDRAVAAARAAFPAFSTTSVEERIALIERIIEAYRERISDFEAIVSEEMGAPRSAEVQSAGPLLHFAEAIRVLKEYPFETTVGGGLVRREAVGVCGLITPWNWPVLTPATMIASALAAGCTIVFKPSEYSPICGILLTEVIHAAGVPKGVLNLVLGDGPGVGSAMCRHPGIDMISFTGSTRAGILVAESAASTVKRVSQELGGKSANIVLPDADLHEAARFNIRRGMFNAGQSCHSPSRILVHESQKEELVSYLAAEAATVVLGNPTDDGVTLGPVVNRAQFERIQGYIASGIEEGARLVCGGPGRPAGFNRGYFVQPTVFADVTPSMKIAQEEIFGPVLSVISYGSEEEAVSIANGTPYGLGGYVFASSPERGMEIGKKLRAGRIFINGAPPTVAAPMGGYKQSGNGRSMGVFGLEEYLEVKAVFGYGVA